VIDGIFYEQSSQFPNGKVEAVYSKTEQGGLKVVKKTLRIHQSCFEIDQNWNIFQSLYHEASQTKAEVTFKKAFGD
jgi:hypothetical protein